MAMFSFPPSNPTRSRIRSLYLVYILGVLTHNLSCFASALVVDRTSLDRETIKGQLGYVPPNFLSVSAKTVTGVPIAIKTYPLQKSKKTNDVGTPFPTLYWLTHPDISRSIAELERNGYIKFIEDYLSLESNASKRKALLYCHQQCARERWATLESSDRLSLLQKNCLADPTLRRMRQMIHLSGIAGTNYPAHINLDGVLVEVSIKCLHTHYAHFRSTLPSCQLPPEDAPNEVENPVGRLTHELLQEKFPLLEL